MITTKLFQFKRQVLKTLSQRQFFYQQEAKGFTQDHEHAKSATIVGGVI
ncbi:MAG: hypothetical protein HRU19_23970 [Pseudobacteriovorax sp.]|nr:hypothetical protein [Pseudobacteriovorax sp.]